MFAPAPVPPVARKPRIRSPCCADTTPARTAGISRAVLAKARRTVLRWLKVVLFIVFPLQNLVSDHVCLTVGRMPILEANQATFIPPNEIALLEFFLATFGSRTCGIAIHNSLVFPAFSGVFFLPALVVPFASAITQHVDRNKRWKFSRYYGGFVRLSDGIPCSAGCGSNGCVRCLQATRVQ